MIGNYNEKDLTSLLETLKDTPESVISNFIDFGAETQDWSLRQVWQVNGSL